jgi:hypothetical protein
MAGRALSGGNAPRSKRYRREKSREERRCVLAAGKKGGKGGKKGGSELDKVLQKENSSATKHPPSDPATAMHSLQLLSSFTNKSSGSTLVDARGAEVQQAADLLYSAPLAVLSHLEDEEEGSDGSTTSVARYTYANLAAQSVFNYSWDAIVGLDSRLSAPEGNERNERASAIDDAVQRGFSVLPSGVRVSSNGIRFKVLDAKLWVIDAPEKGNGLAAAFDRIELIDPVPESSEYVFASGSAGDIFIAGDDGRWVKEDVEGIRNEDGKRRENEEKNVAVDVASSQA